MPQTNPSAIGRWARSKRNDRTEGGKFHLVESIINDQYLTRCGRYMKPKTHWREMEIDINDPYGHDAAGSKCWVCVNSVAGQKGER